MKNWSEDSRILKGKLPGTGAPRESFAGLKKDTAFFEDDLTGDFLTDADGIILDCNPAFLRIFGYEDKSEVLGQSITALYPDPSERASILRELFAKGMLEGYETTRKRKDGSLVTIDENVVATFDQEGKLVEVKSYIYDVTAQKRSTEAWHRSEERYRALFESINEAFCIIQVIFDESGKGIDYRFLEMNPAFERHTGLMDAVGKTARELIPDLEERWSETYGRVATTGNREQFVDVSAAMDRWFEIDCFRIGDPEERKVALLFNDITERKKGEDLRRYHSLLLSSVQDAIIAHDDRLRISYWGKGAEAGCDK
jgi:PAS domain S-box-containing protein